jgi:hypothetical protein
MKTQKRCSSPYYARIKNVKKGVPLFLIIIFCKFSDFIAHAHGSVPRGVQFIQILIGVAGWGERFAGD